MSHLDQFVALMMVSGIVYLLFIPKSQPTQNGFSAPDSIIFPGR